MSLNSAPQRVPVSLIRLDGSVALIGHYIVDMISTRDGQYPSEHFVGSSRQIILLSGYRDLEPGDILSTASVALLRVPLEALVTHDARNNVTAVVVSPMPSAAPSLAINAPPDTLDEHPSKLLRRLNNAQRKSFFHLWKTVPSHIRRTDFALDAFSWDPSAIDAHSATPTEYADIFSSSTQDYDDCSLRPFEIKVPPGTQPIQSRPSRLNPVLSEQANVILDSYLAAGLIQHSTFPWSNPLVRSEEIQRNLNHSQRPKTV